MTRQVMLSLLLASAVSTSSAWAHHRVAGKAHPVDTMVRLTEPVTAGGQLLQPGTYEVVVNDDRPAAPSGEPSEKQRTVDFLRDGKIVASDVAEVFPFDERSAVGTSGGTDRRARVDLLKGGEFVRIAVSDNTARYLIHLPAANPASKP